MSVTDDVREFIATTLDGGEIGPIEPDDDLLGSGIIDSFGLEQLIMFLQERYDIRVDPTTLTPADFRSLRSVASFVQRQGGR